MPVDRRARRKTRPISQRRAVGRRKVQQAQRDHRSWRRTGTWRRTSPPRGACRSTRDRMSATTGAEHGGRQRGDAHEERQLPGRKLPEIGAEVDGERCAARRSPWCRTARRPAAYRNGGWTGSRPSRARSGRAWRGAAADAENGMLRCVPSDEIRIEHDHDHAARQPQSGHSPRGLRLAVMVRRIGRHDARRRQ